MSRSALLRLCTAALQTVPSRQLNCNVAAVTRVHRRLATQLYPTRVVLTDGSTIAARYPQPRKIIKLPLDLTTLTEEQRLLRLQRRKPRQKVALQEEVEDSFDASQYRKFWKR